MFPLEWLFPARPSLPGNQSWRCNSVNALMHDPSIALARGCWQTFRCLAVTREENSMRSKWSRILCAVIGILLCAGAASDQPIAVLLDLSFDWPVIGSRGTVVPAVVNRRGRHGQHGLPDDTLIETPSWVNFRRYDNPINLGPRKKLRLPTTTPGPFRNCSRRQRQQLPFPHSPPGARADHHLHFTIPPIIMVPVAPPT